MNLDQLDSLCTRFTERGTLQGKCYFDERAPRMHWNSGRTGGIVAIQWFDYNLNHVSNAYVYLPSFRIIKYI